MNEQDEFLQVLAENEDDTALRLFYADWLDEHGLHEEADRQRKWPAAKEWFVKFCREHNPAPAVESDVRAISREELIDIGRRAIEKILASRHYDKRYESPEQMLENGWDVLEKARLIDGADHWEFELYFGNNYDMCWAVADNIQEFWKKWSVVTGIPLPPGVESKSTYRCAC
jgi:uncharacterized protein (TIGR02996 family)